MDRYFRIGRYFYMGRYSRKWNTAMNESTEVHNPRRDCAILTLAHETHQTDVYVLSTVQLDVMHKRRG